MNTFEYSDLLPPLSLGVANLFFAGILHRAIVRNPTLLSRRHFLESLAALAFMIAIALMATGFVLWRENPRFVLVCSGGWMLACTAIASALRHRSRRRADEELALPDMWPDSAERPIDVYSGAQEHHDPLTTPPTHARMVPLDAFTRARLKKARRERLADTRLRMNRSAQAKRESTRRDSSEDER